MNIITSSANPLVKHLTKIAQSNAYRLKNQQTLLEGNHLVQSWHLHAPQDIQHIIISEDGFKNKTLNHYFKYKLCVIDTKIWKEITSLPTDDVLGIINFNLKPFKTHTYGLILDNIQDSGNMGNLIRTACAAEYDFVLAIKGANIYSPKVLRSAMGGHLGINMYQTQDINMVQNVLIKNKVHIYATCLENSQNIYEANIQKNHVWVIGNEGQGIDDSWQDIAKNIYIPQNTKIESLNASSAGSICLYEKVRRGL